MNPELKIHLEFTDWLGSSYPDIYFVSDPSGLYVESWKTRKTLLKMRSRHAQLDIIVAEPRRQFIGLVIELKSATPFRLDGTLKSDRHLEDQQATMNLLESKGYKCNFAWSLEQAKQIAISYLGEPVDQPLF